MQNTTRFLFFLLLFGLFGAVRSGAQVVINEYSAANWNQFPDNYGKHEDWVELYNTGNTPVSLGNWGLSDKDSTPLKWQFPAGAIIGAHQYLVVWCSKRNESSGGNYHTSFSLTQTKGNDKVVLAKPDGTVVDMTPVEKTQVTQSRCRSVDGTGIWKICSEPTPGNSNNNSQQFVRFAIQPVMSLAAGFYSGAQTVTITSNELNGVIRYTIDGTLPTQSSPQYTHPLDISHTTVVKACVFSNDPTVFPSFVEFNTYFIDESFSLVVVSVAADQLLDLANGQKDLIPVGSIEYFGKDQQRRARSYGELNSHGQDSWVNNQRSLDWVSRDEMGYTNALQDKLFGYSDRDEYQRIILRASGDDNYPGNFLPQHDGCAHIRDEYSQSLAKVGGLKLDVRSAERMIVFLNGQYWGVYGLREYPDDSDYTEYYYNQGKYDIQVLETWGNSWAEYGGDQAFNDWRPLQNFILNNDMGEPANYQQVKDQLNVTSMCDYFICGLTFVASDWINYNTAWWRGTNPDGDHKKWGYMLWDFDAVFHYYINYSGVPNTNANAEPCDIDQISDYIQNSFFSFDPPTDTCQFWGGTLHCDHPNGKHDVLFRKLQAESPEFRQLYYSRQADLQNTVFSCQNMLHVLDSMAAVIDPEMTRHAARWGGSYADWKHNIDQLRNFISQRCQLLDDGMTDCFNLTGPYPVTLMVDPPGAGTINFNTLKISNFPWTGNYFGNMENSIEAKEKSTLPFLRWELRSGGGTVLDANADSTALLLTAADTLVAVFGNASAVHEPENHISLAVTPTLATDQISVSYKLPEAMPVSMALYSVLGQQVLQIPQAPGNAGQNAETLQLDPYHLSSGTYFLKFRAGGYEKTVQVYVRE